LKDKKTSSEFRSIQGGTAHGEYRRNADERTLPVDRGKDTSIELNEERVTKKKQR